MQGSVLVGGVASRESAVSGMRVGERIMVYLPLVKPKIIVLLAFYGAVTALVAGEGRVAPGSLLLFTLFAAMSAGGAATLNHLFERKTDALMERTRSRPLPSGRVSPAGAATLAVVLLGLSIPAAWWLLNGAVALQLALGAAIYGGLYTLVLKRRTPWNIVIGGAAGGNMALAGWALVDPSLPIGAWLLATVVFLWTPPHFWGLAIARDSDYRNAGIPMLPQVSGVAKTARSMALYAVASLLVSLAVAPFTALGMIYLVGAAVFGAAFSAACMIFWWRPTVKMASSVFKGSGIYLALLLTVMAVDLFVG